jgi:hypothetical protein
MANLRNINVIVESRRTIEGAGVRLRRAFGHDHHLLDPFLLLDDFQSDDPEDYIAGFPWHPHRGIETITYMLQGKIEHKDSLGNTGVIRAGDVQWMTAGSGIIHEEMPAQSRGWLWGFQLWTNLPAANKMTRPRYQEILAENIPTAHIKENVSAKVICGQIAGVRGPVRDIVTNPGYFDVTIQPRGFFSHSVPRNHNVFAYVIQGNGEIGGTPFLPVAPKELVLFEGDGDIDIIAGDMGLRLLLVSGRPIRQPVAWEGPIVMNTELELRIAFEEYSNGTFIKHK